MRSVPILTMTIALNSICVAQPQLAEREYETERVEIKLNDTQRQALLLAPHQVMNFPPSDDIKRVILAADVQEISAERVTQTYIGNDPERRSAGVSSWVGANIHYAPVRYSPTRVYWPKVRCVSREHTQSWSYCQDESWIRLKTDAMEKPIQFQGELSDELVEQALQFIDEQQIVSPRDGEIITSARVFRIMTHPVKRLGVIKVGVERLRNEGWFTFYLKTYLSEDGDIDFTAMSECC